MSSPAQDNPDSWLLGYKLGYKHEKPRLSKRKPSDVPPRFGSNFGNRVTGSLQQTWRGNLARVVCCHDLWEGLLHVADARHGESTLTPGSLELSSLSMDLERLLEYFHVTEAPCRKLGQLCTGGMAPSALLRMSASHPLAVLFSQVSSRQPTIQPRGQGAVVGHGVGGFIAVQFLLEHRLAARRRKSKSLRAVLSLSISGPPNQKLSKPARCRWQAAIRPGVRLLHRWQPAEGQLDISERLCVPFVRLAAFPCALTV